MKTALKKILVIGDGNAPTGFGRVVHSVLERLPQDIEIHHLGINYHGEPHDARWKIYPASLNGDVFGVDRLPELLETIQPQLVFAVCDLWVLSRYAQVLERYRKTIRTVFYFPVEGAPVDPALAVHLRYVDRLVAYNEFGAEAMGTAFEEAAHRLPNLSRRPVDIVPHGVDTGTFYPLPGTLDGDRSAARQALLPPGEEFQTGFIVLNANRNQPRKRIDLTMKGFARFAQDKPDNVKLYLHMGVDDCGWNLQAMARRLDLEGRLILTSMESHNLSESEETLNRIYNACDVGINTSTGEGWGLVSFEHGATGAAQSVPGHSSCLELWEGAAEIMEPSYSLTNERILTEGWFVTEETVAHHLERLYADRDLLRQRSRQAFEAATAAAYDWDAIARQWLEVFEDVMAGHPLQPAETPALVAVAG